jgi:2-succinyl-6-hydroxy-2,4-cyclohexadiene-1-carboxylate synthase
MRNMAPFNYRFLDQGDDLIVILHGMFGCIDDFIFLKSYLKKHSLLFIDLPGHGGSSIFSEQTFNSVSKTLGAFLGSFNKKTIHLLGYSMGGRIALQVAALFPALIHSLCLESAHPGLSENEAKNRLRTDMSLSQTLENESFFEDWYSKELFYNYKNAPSYKASLKRKNAHSITNYQLALTQFSSGHQPDLKEVFKLAIPISYLYGEKDQKYCTIASNLSSYNINCIKISNTGHNCHAENEEDYLKALKCHYGG